MYKYIGQQIIFGIYKLSEISDMFSSSGFTCDYPCKSKDLKKNKFEEYHSKLTIDIDEFLNLMNETFKCHIILGSYSLSKYHLIVIINSWWNKSRCSS